MPTVVVLTLDQIRSSLEVVEIGRDFVTKGADSLGDEGEGLLYKRV